MHGVEMLNGVASGWARWAGAGVIEASILLGVVALVLLIAGKRLPAAAAHLALLVVLVKSLLPVGIPVPRPELSDWLGRGAERNTQESEAAVAVAHASPTASQADTRPVAAAAVHSPAVESDAGAQKHAADATAIARPDARSAGQAVTLSWQAYAMLVWLAVSFGLVMKVVCSQWKLRRALAHAFVPGGGAIESIVQELGRRLGVRRSIAVVEGPSDISPGIAGCWRPTLIVPRGLETRLSREQLEWVLLHELAHVRRGDLWWLLLVRVCQAVAWFNPTVWLASHGAEHYRECACDELALEHASCGRGACGEAFLTLLAGAYERSGFAMEFLPHRRLRKYRLRRLVDDRFTGRTFGNRLSAVFVAGAVVLAALSLGERPVAAEVSSESNPHEGESAECPVDSDAQPSLNEAQPIADRIRKQQKAPIHSARMRVKVLHLSSTKESPVQQGHELGERSQHKMDWLLERTDFSQPDCFRKLRDELVEGNLILDHPAYQTIDLTWKRINAGDTRFRVALDSKSVLTYAEGVVVEHVVGDRVAFVQRFPRLMQQSGLGNLLQDSLWHTGPAAFSSVLSQSARSQLPVFTRGPIRTILFATPRMTLQLTNDERLVRLDAHDATHSAPIRELDFQEYRGGIVFPRVRIRQYFDDPTRLQQITVTMIEHAEFNIDIPDSEFRMAVPANTAVWDRRGELRLRAAEKATDDVLTLFER